MPPIGRNHNSPSVSELPWRSRLREEIPPSGGNAPLGFLNSLSSGASCGGSHSPRFLYGEIKLAKKVRGGCEENGCEGRSSASCKSSSHPKRKYPSGHIGISFVSLLANFTTIMPVQNFLHHPMHHHRHSVRRSDAGGQALLQGVVCLKSGGGGDEGTLQPRWRWWSGHCPTPIWSASSTPSVVTLLDPIGRHKPPHATS